MYLHSRLISSKPAVFRMSGTYKPSHIDRPSRSMSVLAQDYCVIIYENYLSASEHVKTIKPMLKLESTNDPDTLYEAQEQIRQGN
jgi:hypothetical protein